MNKNASLREKVDIWQHMIMPKPRLRLDKEVEHAGNWIPNCFGETLCTSQVVDPEALKRKRKPKKTATATFEATQTQPNLAETIRSHKTIPVTSTHSAPVTSAHSTPVTSL
ncbi:hypothetical protein KIW84_061163 [Lathyrus oleraceus]|uniref:Uncharacterized protein n=1 Tax=Pisum sativum TaxID=3888 RepID=A0A9D5A1W8_PEA|nr:hypothetical protein KIW84_061163 [Pisum sativum]